MTYRRWYDQDPVLAKALEELRCAPSVYHAQVALNIMKVIVEHQAELELKEPSDLLETLATQQAVQGNALPRRRWYDANQTLQSAMQLLHDTPQDLQTKLIPNIAEMIEAVLHQAMAGQQH
jgi:hypothetical protein